MFITGFDIFLVVDVVVNYDVDWNIKIIVKGGKKWMKFWQRQFCFFGHIVELGCICALYLCNSVSVCSVVIASSTFLLWSEVWWMWMIFEGFDGFTGVEKLEVEEATVSLVELLFLV